MNKQSWLVLIVVLALVGGTGAFLEVRKARQKLGRPGVKVVAEPIYGEDKSSGSTNIFLAGTNRVDLPERVLDYVARLVPVSKITLDWLPKDTVYGNKFYTAADGFGVYNSVVLMGGDRTSIHQPQYCLQGSGWRIDSSEETTITIDRPHRYELPVMQLMLTRDFKNEHGQTETMRGLYIYWFVDDRQLTANHKQRMWWLARDMMKTGVMQRWAYVICMSTCRPGQEEAATKRMKEFITASVPEYQLTTGPASGVLSRQ